MKKHTTLIYSLLSFVLSALVLFVSVWAWFALSNNPSLFGISAPVFEYNKTSIAVDGEIQGDEIVLVEFMPGDEHEVVVRVTDRKNQAQYLKVEIWNPSSPVYTFTEPKEVIDGVNMNMVMGVAWEEEIPDGEGGTTIQKVYKRFSELLEGTDGNVVDIMINTFVPRQPQQGETDPPQIFEFKFWLVFFSNCPGKDMNLFQNQEFKIDRIQVVFYDEAI